MKINMPITQREQTLKDSISIVSKTDAKGMITYVNREFIEVSGFTEEELMGSNHNMVRHPDMPPAAYADLWDTVQSGKPWIGIVKNRCKNGDHYWVDVCITPMREGGEIVGYISVRKKATREQIEATAALYESMSIEQSFAASMLRKFHDYRHSISIQAKILSIFVMVALTSLMLGYSGVHGIVQSNNSIESIYKHQILPLEKLKIINDLYINNIAATGQKLQRGIITSAQATANVEQAIATLDKEWKAYGAAPHSEAEQKLTGEMQPLFDTALEAAVLLQKIIATDDLDRLMTFNTSDVYKAIDPFTQKLTELINLHYAGVADEYGATEAKYLQQRNVAIGLIVLALAICGVLGWNLNRSIMPRLREISRDLLTKAQEIDNDQPDLQSRYRDELTDVVEAYRSLKTRLDFDHSETMNRVNRLKSALDHASVAVTLSSEDNLLIYMNHAAETLFQSMASVIAQHHAGFKCREDDRYANRTVSGRCSGS